MAEGTVLEGIEPEKETEVAVEGLCMEEVKETAEQLAVRPKVRQPRSEVYLEEEGLPVQKPWPGQPASGEWWHSSALTATRMPTTPI